MAQFNFRLFLRPTAIGKAIIERLSADGADRQADSRRWIELGYALEQAGFRLDGTALYLGGRPFVAEQTLTAQAPVSAQQPAVVHAPAHHAVAAVPAANPAPANEGAVDASSGAALSPAPAPAAQPVESALPRPASPVAPPARVAADDEMANNLRGLSA